VWIVMVSDLKQDRVNLCMQAVGCSRRGSGFLGFDHVLSVLVAVLDEGMAVWVNEVLFACFIV